MRPSALLLLRLLPLVVAGCETSPGPEVELCYTPGARFPAETPALPCLPADDTRVRGFLDREEGHSADLVNDGPFERTTDAGEVRCCYLTQQRPSGSGRPLVITQVVRVARLRVSASWPC